MVLGNTVSIRTVWLEVMFIGVGVSLLEVDDKWYKWSEIGTFEEFFASAGESLGFCGGFFKCSFCSRLAAIKNKKTSFLIYIRNI